MESSEDKIHECGTVLIQMLNDIELLLRTCHAIVPRLEKVERELAKLKPDYSPFTLNNLGDEIDGD